MTAPTLRKRRLTSGREVWVDDDGRIVDRQADERQEECWKCGGTGTFLISGYFENGVFKGRSGTCFECNGKGYCTEADEKRNENYNRYHRKVYL